jgi:hypothetical protein
MGRPCISRTHREKDRPRVNGCSLVAILAGCFMRRRPNRKIERSGVNAARALFERIGCIFQEVDTANDYGKDAYVDLAHGCNISGLCVALQIKSGKKYKRKAGYCIPVEGHGDLWKKSTIPIAGVVFDAELNKLFWCDITSFLQAHPILPSLIPVDPANELTDISVAEAFGPHFRELALQRTAEQAVLRLCSGDMEVRRLAMLDCLAFGRSDASVFIILRRLMPMFRGRSLRIAINVLAHATLLAEVIWSERSWVPEAVAAKVRPHCRWTCKEIYRMLAATPWEKWQRADSGQDLYMLLSSDPGIRRKMERVAIKSIRWQDLDVAWAALYLTVYWAAEKGVAEYERLIQLEPDFRSLELIGDLEWCLGETGALPLF